MNNLLKFAVISLLGFNGYTMHDEIREESNYLKQTFNSLCVENNEDTTAKIAFDFGNGIITESQHFKFKVTTDYQSKPALKTSGNITLDEMSFSEGTFAFSCELPSDDGCLSIEFENEGIKANGTIYSMKGQNGNYAVSCLSKYYALSLLNELPGHQYMDNDSIEAEDRGPTADFKDTAGEPNRVVAGGKVYGYLKWTDDAGKQHPLVGAKVKLTFTGSWGDASTYTNSSGYFSINFSGIWTAWAYECDIHVYAENNMGKVINDSGTVYEYAQRLQGMENNDSYNFGTYVFSISKNDDLARAMQIFSAIYNYSNYARSLNGGNDIEQCKIIYPVNDDEEGSFYSDGSNTIHLGKASQNESGCPAVHASWDTIGHEYGHHLQYHYFQQNYCGTHYTNYNDIYSYFVLKSQQSSNYNIDSTEIVNAKKQGVGLAWKEAWPTFFAISAQSTFSSDIKTIPTVGDSKYESYSGVKQSLKATSNENSRKYNSYDGESDEQIIMGFLYRLWDKENSLSFDKISISDSDLWTVMTAYNPENFSSFINSLTNSGLSFSQDSLGKLLEGFRLSASNFSITSSMDDYSTIPTFSWTANGSNISFNGNTYNYGNNKFILSFYDSSMGFIGEYETTSTRTQIPSLLWRKIVAANGGKYYARIKSYATLGFETGPYYSGYYEFSKPNSATETISISNSRYFERSIAIAPGTEYTFNIKFDFSGTKLLQTFGNSDVVMSLYSADGTTLIESDDDDGYGKNALIYRYLYNDTNYILKLRMYGSSTGGLTRLCIAPIYGAQSSDATNMYQFENFVNIKDRPNYEWGSYLATKYSKMITWTVPEDGKYKLTLTSEFDNYLYVIDPTSPNDNVYDVNYNDDCDGRNAAIENNYVKGKTYAIFYCQYNPSNVLDSSGTGNDISLKIQKL